MVRFKMPRFSIKFFLYLTGLNVLLVAWNIFLLHPSGDLNTAGNTHNCNPHPPFLSRPPLATSTSRRRFEDDASLPIPISIFQQQPNKNASACNNLNLDLQGIRILLLDVHFEGNLGDEMETTPLLQHLFDCGAHITAALSEWRPLTSTQKVHPRTAREHMLVHKIISREKYYSTFHNDNDNHNDFDAVILAPGPWKPCLLKSQWPHLMIDIYFGGSFVADPSCPSNTNSDSSSNNELLLPPDLLEFTQLIVTREPASYEWIQKHLYATSSSFKSKKTPKLIMGADLSYSYRPSRAAIDYWSDHYRSYQDEIQILVFTRENNFNTGVRILGGGGNPRVMLKVQNGSKITVPLSQVIFASSSDIEDSEHFKWLQSNYRLVEEQERQVVMCTSVEQLFGLLLGLGPQGHVYTDRYHPGVAAHTLGVPFTTLSYPAEQIKLKGLAELTATKTPRELKHLNGKAFAALDHYLATTLQARKKDGTKNYG